MNAVLGVSEQCIAAHPSDMCVALLALDARVHTQGPRGERTIALADFHSLMGTHPERESVLGPGETRDRSPLPLLLLAARSAYAKVTRSWLLRARAGLGGCRARARRLDRALARSRQAAWAAEPWRCPEVEQALLGKPATSEPFKAASALAMQEAKTTPDNQFKVELARRVIARAPVRN